MDHLILVIVTLVIVAILSYLLRRLLNLLILRKSQQLNADPTNFIFLKNAIPFVLYGIAIIWIFNKIPYFESLGTALFAGAGVLAAIVGFASQKAFSNIIGGIFILIFKPFRVGDVIEISNNRVGMVESITLRHTIIRNYEARRIVIPNSVISDETITNSTIEDEKIRKHIVFDISYESSIDVASEIIEREILNHPLCIDNRSVEDIQNNEKIVDVKLISLGDSGMQIKAFVWTNTTSDAFALTCDVLRSIKLAFDQNNIEIPYPHRTLVYKNNEKKESETTTT